MPSHPVDVLQAALNQTEFVDRLALLQRCIDWLDRALREARVQRSLEIDQAMEEWMCEECELMLKSQA